MEAEQPPLAYGDPAERPPNTSVDEVELERWRDRVTTAPLATRDRSDQAGFHWERLEPGKTGSVPLPGRGVRHPRGRGHAPPLAVALVRRGDQAPSRRRSIRPGHVIARPPATRVSHSFRAGPDGLTMLIYGTRKPNDMTCPRSNKIAWRGLGVIGQIEVLDYFDGEPDDSKGSGASGR